MDLGSRGGSIFRRNSEYINRVTCPPSRRNSSRLRDTLHQQYSRPLCTSFKRSQSTKPRAECLQTRRIVSAPIQLHLNLNSLRCRQRRSSLQPRPPKRRLTILCVGPAVTAAVAPLIPKFRPVSARTAPLSTYKLGTDENGCIKRISQALVAICGEQHR